MIGTEESNLKIEMFYVVLLTCRYHIIVAVVASGLDVSYVDLVYTVCICHSN